ncbi:hypothetical protein CAEBREN_02997 [Caenorhabditis brenneri]|uniref:Protein-tyrosine-phosphatase n=1 Tax=Caenorhabditis brenneri TaxID=135651 RepID=G0MZV3_CAEBE|nr:hypothetical protein CAEBREN_02997 [Caenorhabditis brenneri]
MAIFLLVYYFAYHDTKTRLESSRSTGDIIWNDQLEYDSTNPDDFPIQFQQHLDSKRNTPSDNLKQLLETSSTIVSVANAIHLQIGLMNRSISVNTAVEEFLHLENVTMVDLTNFKSENVIALAEKLKVKPNSFDASFVNWEEKVKKLNEIRIRSEQLGELEDITGKDEYFTKLESYNTTLDLTTVTNAFDSLEKIVKRLLEIESLKIDEQSDPLQISGAYGDVFNRLPNNFELALSMLDKLRNSMESKTTEIDFFASRPQIFSSIGLLIELSVERHNYTTRSSSSVINTEKQNFRQLDDVKNLFQSSKGDIARFTRLARTRPHPNGFSDKQQLEKRIQSYLEPLQAKDVSLETLRRSLAPFFKLEERLISIEKTLQPIGGASVSLDFWKSLEANLEKLPSSVVDFTDYFTEIDSCHQLNFMEKSHYEKSQTLIKDIGEVGKMFEELSNIIKNIDVEEHKKGMVEFITFLGFTDITDQTKSPDEVPAVLKRVKGSQELKTFKETISEIKNGLDIKMLDGKVQGIIKNKDNLVTTQMKDEAKVYTCLQNMKDKFEEVVPAIHATQELRDLNQKQIEDLETAITAVSDTSNALGNLKDILEIMKKENPEFVGKIKSLSSPAGLDAMVVCVNSLQSAFELKTLNFSISQLENVGLIVDTEIKTIKNTESQKTVQDEWGNHTKDISELENAVAEIEDFEKKLNIEAIKTIADYGAVFEKLGELSDVKINSESKIQALNSLILRSKDTKIKSELGNSKKILERIAPLDLGFSSYKSLFQLAPKSFGGFQQFLIDFSTIFQPPSNKKSGKPTVIYVTDPSTKKKGDDNALIFGIGGTLVFIALVLIALFLLYKFWWKKRKRQPVVDKKAIENWIKKQMFTREKELKYCDAYRVHEAFMISMEIQSGQADKVASQKYLPESKQRGDKLCNPATALHHLKKDGRKMPIHANLVPMKKSKRKEDTREDFWHMVMHEGVENIVMLCLVEELAKDEVYYGVSGGTTLQFGRYKVKTIQAKGWKSAFSDTVGYRQIEVTDTKGTYPTRLINHYHYIDWKDMKFPRCGNAEEVYHILKEVTKSKAPTVVHCVAGIGRTMTFIGVQFAAEAVKLNQNVTMVEVLTQLRQARWEAVQTIRQSYWLQTAVCYKLNEDYKLGMDAQIEEILETFQQVAQRHRGPPEFLAKREKNKDLKAAGKSEKFYCPPKTDKDFGVYIQY